MASFSRLARGLAFALACALGCGALAGCESAAASRDRDTLVDLEPGDANTINPLFANNQPAFLYANFVFDGLVEIGPKLGVLPGLAKAWHASSDFLHWTVDLRENAPWSDGRPFDSRDVIFTWKATLDPKVGDPYAGQFDFLKAVVAEGPYRVRFDLKRRYANFVPLVLGSSILPAHCFAGADPSNYHRMDFGEHPVGNGPYTLVSWDHDNTVLFARNAAYWRGPPKIKGIEVRIILNPDQYGEALHEGTADVAEITNSTEYRRLRLDPGNLVFIHVPDLFTRFILIDLRTPGLNDLSLRQAMNYGWDRADVTQGTFHDDERPDDTVTPWGLSYWHDTKVPVYTYDPARARALLDRAGWKLGPDGVRVKNGIRADYDLKFADNGTPGLADPMIVFKNDMAEIGIRIELHQLDYPTFIDDTANFKYELAYSGWGGATDPDQYTFLHSSQAPPVGNNYTGFADKAVDRDLVLGQSAVTPAERRVYYDDMQVRTTAAAPVVFGYDDYYRVVMNPRVDVRGDREPDLNFWWNVYDWRLRS